MSGSRCQTLYPFSGERHRQGLRFAAGELITVLQVPDGGWWEGQKEDGLRGWFPASYVQLLEVGAGPRGSGAARVGAAAGPGRAGARRAPPRSRPVGLRRRSHCSQGAAPGRPVPRAGSAPGRSVLLSSATKRGLLRTLLFFAVAQWQQSAEEAMQLLAAMRVGQVLGECLLLLSSSFH